MKVIDGKTIWQLKATHGLPLDMALMLCAKHGVVPSWDDLMKAALADGANMGRLVRELQFLCVKHTQRILLKSSAQGCQHWHCE